MKAINSSLKTLGFSLILSSCLCNPGTIKYPLDDSAQNILPYALGDNITMQHTGGYSFDMEVIARDTDWFGIRPALECRPEVEAMISFATLISDYPDFNLGLQVLTISDQNSLEVNFLNSRAYIPFDTLNAEVTCGYGIICHDSITIGEKICLNITEVPFTKLGINSESTLSPESLFWDDKGVLQITLNNAESFTRID